MRIFGLLVGLVFILIACSSPAERGRSSAPTGRWDESHGAAVADLMIDGMRNGSWLQRWTNDRDGRPTVLVGPLQSKTDRKTDGRRVLLQVGRKLERAEHVQVANDSTLRLRSIGQTRCGGEPPDPLSRTMILAQEAGADFVLFGSLRSDPPEGSASDQARISYTVRLELVNVERNVTAWSDSFRVTKPLGQHPVDAPDSTTMHWYKLDRSSRKMNAPRC